MIIYILNNFFPDNSGFGKRCYKEIEFLSKMTDVVVICRKNKSQKEQEDLTTKYRLIKIIRFHAKSNIIERINQHTYINGLYELKRNIDLMFNLFSCTSKVLWDYRYKTKIRIYAVVSPLTVPLIGYILAKLFRRSAEVIEFHDLEPELAIHIKKQKKDSLIVRIEFSLEKFLCSIYKKVVVTNGYQAKTISKRSNLYNKNIIVIPNNIQVEETFKNESKISLKYNIKVKDFVIGYVSNFSYDFTISGLIELFELLAKNPEVLRDIKIILVGDGDGLETLKNNIKTFGLENSVISIGRVLKTSEIISRFDIGLIPWTKSEISESILPTKLFEYLYAKKTVLVPNFGEFKKIINNFENGVLFNTPNELLNIIQFLKSNKNKLNEMGIKGYKLYKEYKNKYNENYFIEEVYAN